MSYRLDIDEYTNEALITELRLRAEHRRKSNCDYCYQPWGIEPWCKFPLRHAGQEEGVGVDGGTITITNRSVADVLLKICYPESVVEALTDEMALQAATAICQAAFLVDLISKLGEV